MRGAAVLFVKVLAFFAVYAIMVLIRSLTPILNHEVIVMLSGISPYSTYGAYGASYAGRAAQAQGTDKSRNAQSPALVMTAHKAAQPETPVQPVTPVRSISGGEDPAQAALLRQGSDPVEMAVRMRIQYPDNDVQGQNAASALAGQAKDPAVEQSKSAQEVMEEGECQTCKERKYQDGSDDPGVSFKTPTNVSPDQAASAVRGHENEHVVREQAKAQREDRRVVSQNVTIHNDICPECGKVYVSGGTTRTVTKADGGQQSGAQQQNKQDPRVPFSAVA